MGYPMASNLRKKIPKESTLYINDVNSAAVEQFVKEHTSYGPVKVASSAKQVTENSVLLSSKTYVGCNLLDCAQGIPREVSLLR
jgi:3-hydroxyisobutyrate dehydrogenase